MTYDDAFYEEEGRVAKRSAAEVMPWLYRQLAYDARYAIDVGGGTGEWGAAWRLWTEGEFLVIDQHPDGYQPRLVLDISNGVNCTGWDLAICLEVAEHLPPESAEPLVAGLAQATTVLFSAATPGQPGVNHINCQPHDYWHQLFAAHGMTPEFIGDKFTEPVADFYRRNMYLYRRTSGDT